MVDESVLRKNIEEIISSLREHGAPQLAASMKAALNNDSRTPLQKDDRYLNYRTSLLIFRTALDAVLWTDQIHTLLNVQNVRFVEEQTNRLVYASVSERLGDVVNRLKKLRAICDDLLQPITIK